MPTKDETTVAANVRTDAQVIAKAAEKQIIRKEMKKANSPHMARVSDEFPHRLILNADTPYEAYYAALKSKYSSVADSNKTDFFTLDSEWYNKFKVQDKNTDPDKIFSVLEEHSKKNGRVWCEIRERCIADAEQNPCCYA